MAKNNLTVEIDNCGRAHIFVTKPYNARLRVIVTKDNVGYYTYDIVRSIIVPLQMGTGIYSFQLYRHVCGIPYKTEGFEVKTLQISNPRAPFLFPNVYVNYNPKSIPIFKNIEEVKDFMLQFSYDYDLAKSLKGFILPSIATTLFTKRGICQDFAAIAVALFRNMTIPARLVIGKADGHSYAWCEYWDVDHWKLYDPTAIITQTKIKVYAIKRYY